MNIKMFFTLVLLMLVSACTKLTIENYDQLKMGMNLEEVENIIGSPNECTKTLGTTNCLWGNEDGRHIKINFVGGSAVMFVHEGLE